MKHSMQAKLISQTPGSIKLKDIMLDLYNKQETHTESQLQAHNAYYSKVIIANLVNVGVIKEKHRNHGIYPVFIEEANSAIQKLRKEIGQAQLQKDLNNTLEELKYNDHFIQELMAEIMENSQLNFYKTTNIVKDFLTGNSPELATKTEKLQMMLKEIGGQENIVNDKFRHFSSLEIEYAFQPMRLETAKKLITEDKVKPHDAFDIICRLDGNELKAVKANGLTALNQILADDNNKISQNVMESSLFIPTDSYATFTSNNLLPTQSAVNAQLQFATQNSSALSTPATVLLIAAIIGGVGFGIKHLVSHSPLSMFANRRKVGESKKNDDEITLLSNNNYRV